MADRNRARRKPGRGRDAGRDERSFANRAQDEVRSWFGDDQAARRRHRDVMTPEGGEPVARGPRAPLGAAYGERGRTRPGTTSGRRPEPRRSDRPAGPGEPGAAGWREGGGRDRDRPSREPNYGYRAAAGFEPGSDPAAEPGWAARSVSGYGVQWRGRPEPHGPYAGRGPKGYRRNDARIQEDVCDRLADAPDVDASDIETEVRDGEVTLSGTVRDRWQKRRAEDVIDAVSGVREVHNRLRVVQSEPSP